jgi:hypothetical protein
MLVVPGAACAAEALAVQALPDVTAPTMGAIDATWAAAKTVTLEHDFNNRRAADEATTVSVARDGDNLVVAFDARQREGVVASQQTNSSSVFSEDYVGVYLWPQGTQGFSYSFVASPRGARWQTSSENSAYQPPWIAVGAPTQTGYVVTMRIPLSAIRSGGSDAWRVQFVRQVVASNSLDVWTYANDSNNAADPAYAGTFTHFASSAAAAPRARAQIYGLADITTPGYGGSTSRVGADLSLPVTKTSSIVASLHPDYSNVEQDQQTIAPSAFAYQYSEVRPFFTQVAQPFNASFSCSNCPQYLYTPSIPTFRDGFAYEGTQGPFTFGAFNTSATGRNDQAQALDYNVSTPGSLVSANLQHAGVDAAGGIHDEETTITTGYENRHTHEFVYLNAGVDRGSFVTSPGDANYLETGAGVVTPTLSYGANYQHIGAQFNPFDGFVSQTDLNGYESFYRQTFNFAAKDALQNIQTSAFFGEYHNRFGQRAQEYASEQIKFNFRNLTQIQVYGNEEAVRVPSGEFLPFSGNGASVGYRVNTATPLYVAFSGGPYYHGNLDSWQYVATPQLAPNVHLRLETDEDNYLSTSPGEMRSVFWLDRATLDWQISRDASFDLGARRLVGTPLPNAFAPPTNGALAAGNVTAAFHLLQKSNEFYFVYGNPNSLATTPALYIKWIRYIGAPKGT